MADVPLPAGILDQFFIYVHSPTPGRVHQSDVPLNLQIWRNITGDEYRLVYQHRFIVDHSTNTGVYYAVSTGVYYAVSTGLYYAVSSGAYCTLSTGHA